MSATEVTAKDAKSAKDRQDTESTDKAEVRSCLNGRIMKLRAVAIGCGIGAGLILVVALSLSYYELAIPLFLPAVACFLAACFARRLVTAHDQNVLQPEQATASTIRTSTTSD